MFCRECGEENEDNAKFCKSCGSPLNLNEVSEPSQINTNKVRRNFNKKSNGTGAKIGDNSKNKKIIIGCVLGIFLIIGIVIFFTGHLFTNDLKKMNFNVTDELELYKTTDKAIIYQNGTYGDYSFLIKKATPTESNISSDDGYSKYNDYIYKYIGAVSSSSSTTIWFGAYGEYIEINGDTYFVESRFEKGYPANSYNSYTLLNSDMDKILEYLKYFNNNNDVKVLELSNYTDLDSTSGSNSDTMDLSSEHFSV